MRIWYYIVIFSIAMVAGHNKLGRSLSLNLLSGTSKMLWPLAIVNCGGSKPLLGALFKFTT